MRKRSTSIGLHAVPGPLRQPLEACARGDIAPNVALMQLFINSRSVGEVEYAISRAKDAETAAEPIQNLMMLWQNAKGAFGTVKSVMEKADHGSSSGTYRWAAVFDDLAGSSPEAGVALYSLGSPAVLELATGSLVERLREWGLLGRDRVVLDLGCGIGRICAAIAGHVRVVVGTDVSGKMLQVARLKCSGCPNVLLAQTSGRDLATFADETFDLVLAVDSFPYIVLAGDDLAERHIREAHRMLKRGGSLVVFNYAYDTDAAASTEAFSRLSGEAGFAPVRLGTRDLDWWDGITYHVQRNA